MQRLRSAQRGEGWWPGDQLGKPAEVLRNRCQRELELGTAWPAQSQPAEPQDTLQVRKQHFDTLPVAGWLLEHLRLGQRPANVAKLCDGLPLTVTSVTAVADQTT